MKFLFVKGGLRSVRASNGGRKSTGRKPPYRGSGGLAMAQGCRELLGPETPGRQARPPLPPPPGPGGEGVRGGQRHRVDPPGGGPRQAGPRHQQAAAGWPGHGCPPHPPQPNRTSQTPGFDRALGLGGFPPHHSQQKAVRLFPSHPKNCPHLIPADALFQLRTKVCFSVLNVLF